MSVVQTVVCQGSEHHARRVFCVALLGWIASCTAPSPPKAESSRNRLTICPAGPSSFLTSPRAEAQRLLAVRECQLSRDVSMLPGVTAATVRITQGSKPSWDAPAVLPRASVMLSSVRAIDNTAIRGHLCAAVSGLDVKGIQIVRVPISPAPSSREDGPGGSTLLLGQVEVQTSSVGAAKRWLFGLLISNLLTAALLAFVWYKFRQKRTAL